jgi:hypothetical protein
MKICKYCDFTIRDCNFIENDNSYFHTICFDIVKQEQDKEISK